MCEYPTRKKRKKTRSALCYVIHSLPRDALTLNSYVTMHSNDEACLMGNHAKSSTGSGSSSLPLSPYIFEMHNVRPTASISTRASFGSPEESAIQLVQMSQFNQSIHPALQPSSPEASFIAHDLNLRNFPQSANPRFGSVASNLVHENLRFATNTVASLATSDPLSSHNLPVERPDLRPRPRAAMSFNQELQVETYDLGIPPSQAVSRAQSIEPIDTEYSSARSRDYHHSSSEGVCALSSYWQNAIDEPESCNTAAAQANRHDLPGLLTADEVTYLFEK
jgi:hypothetical protein